MVFDTCKILCALEDRLKRSFDKKLCLKLGITLELNYHPKQRTLSTTPRFANTTHILFIRKRIVQSINYISYTSCTHKTSQFLRPLSPHSSTPSLHSMRTFLSCWTLTWEEVMQTDRGFICVDGQFIGSCFTGDYRVAHQLEGQAEWMIIHTWRIR